MGAIINIFVILVATIFPYFSLSRVTINTHAKRILGEMFLGLISIIIGIALSSVLIYLIAEQLDANGHSMVWYSSTYLAPGIYCIITLLSHISVFQLMDYEFGNKMSPLSLGLKVQARLNGVNIFWGILNLAVTIAGFRIGYTMTVILGITCIANIFIFLCKLQNSGEYNFSFVEFLQQFLFFHSILVHKWLFFFFLGQIFVLLWTFNFYHTILNVFIPITGRSGSKNNPDLVIGIICCFMTVFICSYFVS